MRWPRVGGFTLVETLVALFVLAAGIVGASAMQISAQRSRHGAELASDGVRLASSLAERMRANQPAMSAGDSVNPYLFEHDAASTAAPDLPTPCFGSAGCDPLQLAQFDVYETIDSMRTRLPRGRIVVCRDATLWDAARDTLAWDCAPSAGAPLVIKLGWRDHDADAQDVAPPRVALVVPGAG